MAKLKYHPGDRFNKRTLVSHLGKGLWLARCDCGYEGKVNITNLTSGATKGCMNCRDNSIYKGKTKHGLSRTREYTAWENMVGRCTDKGRKDFKWYGGRGITVCTRWLDVRSFVEDMGPCGEGLTIERIDNNKGYEPGNCRWATIKEQQNNRRDNRRITYKGSTDTLSNWCRRLGLNRNRVSSRLNFLKWTPERAFETPIRRRRVQSIEEVTA